MYVLALMAYQILSPHYLQYFLQTIQQHQLVVVPVKEAVTATDQPYRTPEQGEAWEIGTRPVRHALAIHLWLRGLSDLSHLAQQ